MKYLFPSIVLLFYFSAVKAQLPTDPDELIKRGVALHDKGDYKGAISYYDQALKISPHNISALYEKSFSAVAMKDFKTAIKSCKEAIKYNEGAFTLRMIYDNYGTTLDLMKKPEKALKIYDEGIALFPNFYRLQFNKGITLLGMRETEKALESFQEAIKVNPIHASSHHAIGLTIIDHNKIPGILALSRVIIIEPTSERSKNDIKEIKEHMVSNVAKKNDSSYTINMDIGILMGLGESKKKENNFRSSEVMFSLSSALIMAEDSSANETEKYARMFEALFSSLSKKMSEGKGFYWDYYVPYFAELNEKGHTTTFTYLAFSGQGDEYVQSWLDDNKEKIDAFYEWSANYKWE